MANISTSNINQKVTLVTIVNLSGSLYGSASAAASSSVAISSSYASTSSYASSGLSVSSSYSTSGSYALSSSYALSGLSSSYSLSSSYAFSSSYSSTASFAVSSSQSVASVTSQTASTILPTPTGYVQYQSAESWVNTGHTLPAALSAATCANINGITYIYGGTTPTQVTLPYSNQIWTSSATDPSIVNNSGLTLPTPLAYSSLYQFGNTLYMFGGSVGNPAYQTCSIWTASVSTPTVWGLGGSMPTTINQQGIVQIGNTLYMFGGYTATGSGFTPMFTGSYTASSANPLVWSTAQPITWTGPTTPITMSYGAIYTVIDDTIWCLGGQNSQGNGQSMSTLVLTASTSTPFTWGIANASVATTISANERIVIGNYMYLLAGYPGAGGVTNIVWKFPFDKTSLAVGPAPANQNGTIGVGYSAGYRACAVVVPSTGKAYFYGGGDGVNYPAQFNTIYSTNFTNLGVTGSAATNSIQLTDEPSKSILNSFLVGQYAITSSWAINTLTASIVLTASYANSSSLVQPYRTIVSSSTVLVSDRYIYASASNFNIVVTLPSASVAAGQTFTIKKIDTTGYSVIVTGSCNIDFSTNQTITLGGVSLTVVSDANQFWIH